MLFFIKIKKFFIRLHSNSPGMDNRIKHIFYRIIDQNLHTNKYTLQTLNKRISFFASITDIVFDKDLISGLFPEQACYIGIEYAAYLKTHKLSLQKKLILKTKDYLICRYGAYQICYQDRIKNICFICKESKEEFLMDPRDIALSRELIREFDALQAFYIGFSAGLKLNAPSSSEDVSGFKKTQYPHLQIVK